MLLRRCRSVLIAAGIAVATMTGAATAAWAQATGTVRGTVVDRATGRPLDGADVGLAGTLIRVNTDAQGRFMVPRVPSGQQTIRALMIGYTRVEASVTVMAGQEATVDFTLNPAAMQLDEIVVTGQPGRTEKRTLGNAVSKIDAATVAEAAVVRSVEGLLTGRTPGLTAIANSGQAGTGSNFRIRGAGSVEAGYQPVYYIDGIRFESRLQNGYGTGGGATVQPTSPFSFLNPGDIESIEVIKGPSAATLYGADAAGGVIQIITKKGRRGAGVQWTVGAEVGESEWTRHIGNPVNYWLCKPSEIADPTTYPGCAGMDPNAPEIDRFLVHDPLREDTMLDGRPVIRNGRIYKFDVSARGGGDFFNYYLSFDRNSEDGVFWNNYDRRIGGRANIEFTPSEKLDVGVNFGYVRNNGQQPLQDNASNGLLRNALRGQAKGPAPAANIGAPGWRGFSPDLSNSYNNATRTERTTIGITANWRPFRFMHNRLTAGLDKQDRRNTEFYAIDSTGFAPWGSVNATGFIQHWMPVTHVWTADVASTLNFDLSPVLTSSSSAGMQLNKRTQHTYEAEGEGLIANQLNLVSSAAVRRAEEFFTEQASLGFYVQEQVGWRDRLFVTLAIRVDDNSAFGEDFSFVTYPKASVSWVASEEEFFPLAFVDQMKLRFAWGKAGQAPQPFSAVRTYEATTTTAGGTAEVTVAGLTTAEYGNKRLKAEEGVEWEAGFDASLLEGKLGLEFTYYNKHTVDALIGVPDPRSTGFNDEHLENIGEVANRGVELLLTTTPVNSRSLTWDATVSMAANSNKLISFGGAREEITFGSFATTQKHIEGYPLGGLWYNDVERDASGAVIIDPDGNALVDINKYTYVGPSVPTREAALTNTVTLFGNVRLFAHLDYKGGFYVWCALCSVRNRIDQNTLEVNSPDADSTDVLVAKSLQTKTWIYPADFLKLREVSLTYTLPSSWSRMFRASRVSLTLAGRNLRRWTKYKGTGDPEVNFNPTADFTRTDYASVPPMQQLLATARITF